MADYKSLTDLIAHHGSRVQNPGAMARDSIERMNAPYRAIEHVYPPFGAIEEGTRLVDTVDRAMAPLRDAFGYSDSFMKITESIKRMDAPFRAVEKSFETFRAMERMTAPLRDAFGYADSFMKTIESIERANAPFRALERSLETFRVAERMTASIREAFARAESLDASADRDIRNALAHGLPPSTVNYDILFEQQQELPKEKPVIAVGSAIVPEKPVAEGVLVKCTSLVWASIVNELKDDWRKAHHIPSRVWEEIVAGAFKKAKFDEVVLTPRSGDHGRDVIAVRNGVGSIRILGSVKAYKPGHLIAKEEVHALMGVVALDSNASKGLFATTSDFAPMLLGDPRLAASIPHRIELMNGKRLQQWLRSLLDPT